MPHFGVTFLELPAQQDLLTRLYPGSCAVLFGAFGSCLVNPFANNQSVDMTARDVDGKTFNLRLLPAPEDRLCAPDPEHPTGAPMRSNLTVSPGIPPFTPSSIL
jgi:hypothetical protein